MVRVGEIRSTAAGMSCRCMLIIDSTVVMSDTKVQVTLSPSTKKKKSLTKITRSVLFCTQRPLLLPGHSREPSPDLRRLGVARLGTLAWCRSIPGLPYPATRGPGARLPPGRSKTTHKRRSGKQQGRWACMRFAHCPVACSPFAR